MKNLITRNLIIGYPSKEIAKEINLDLKPGSIVCLLGQNGVGKSTLLRTLSNLQEPLSGEIMIDGQSIEKIERGKLATQLGIITTDKIGTSNMTVRELVALGRYPYTNWVGKKSKHDKEKIDEAIDICRINYLLDAKLSTISDGQFQKVMVARVLAQDTDIILMDEPTAHLDIVNRVEMFQLLMQIKEKTGKSILISTHELDLSMQFADELWLMNYNAQMVIGAPEDLGYKGEIEKIFFHEEFKLDSETGQVLLDMGSDKYFNVTGEDKASTWLKKALRRKGYGTSMEGIPVFLESKNGKVMWNMNSLEGESISDLLVQIEKLQ